MSLSLRKRFPGNRGAPRAVAAVAVSGLPLEDPADGRRLRWAIAAALVAHAAVLALPMPAADARPEPQQPPRVVTVLQPVRLVERPPEPTPPAAPPDQPVVRVPVPELPPEAPVTVREVEPLPPPEPPGIELVYLPPPPAPPAPAPAAPTVEAPIPVGGRVARPRAIYTPKPAYTEAARRLRFAGIGIFQLTLDARGDVTRVEVLRPVPLGLTEQATAALGQWRYEPATLNGRAVAVYMTVTVHFTLQ